jgi:16S rRNA (adenine1518-N6/adenine1519-N6)-dimethyltransferase
LRNALAGLLEAGDYAALGIAPGLRAENLGVADFVAISNYLTRKPPRYSQTGPRLAQ